MNTPAGFEFTNGQRTGVRSIQASFSRSTGYEAVHVILACYVACGFAVAAVYAFSMLRGNRDDYRRKGLLLGLAVALIATPLQIVSGDFNARYLAHAQPIKLAALEGVFRTPSHVPLHCGGILDPNTQKFYFSIDIPDGLSLLADYNANGVIIGLDSVPRNDWPDPVPVHLSFDGMVGSGFFALFIAVLFWSLYFLRKRVIPENRWLLRGVVLAGVLGFLAVELGWMVTEEGRQPWVIYGYLRTKDAVTTAPFLNITFLIFSVIYVSLSITMIALLLRQTRRPLPKMECSEVASGPESSQELNA